MSRSSRLTVYALLLAAAFLLGPVGCMSKSYSPSKGARQPSPASVDGKPTSFSALQTQRKIIRDGELHLRIKDYAKARAKLDALLKKSGGYIADAQVHHRGSEVSSASLTLRIPSFGFASMIARLSALGEVTYEKLKSRDVTAQHADLSARMKTAKALEQRFLRILSRASQVGDVLKVEKELSRVRQRIETLTSTRKKLDNLVALATLKVHLGVLAKPAEKPGVVSELGQTLSRSFGALKAFGRGALNVFIALIPWSIPLGLFGFGGLRLWRRRQRKKRAQQQPSVTISSLKDGEQPNHPTEPLS
jgi:hypothetical protein